MVFLKQKIFLNWFLLIVSSTLVIAISVPAKSTEIKLSGWIFQSIVSRDSADDISFEPLGNSLNQVSFDVSQEAGNGLTVGANLRIASVSSDFNAVQNERIDQQSLYIKGDFGTFDLGTNHTATAFLDNYDETPTYWPDPMGWLSVFSATGFNRSLATDSNGNLNFTGATLRDDRLRYVSPSFSGFTIRADLGDNDSNELALIYRIDNVIVNLFRVDNGGSSDEITGFMLVYNSVPGVQAVYTASTQDVGADEYAVSGWKLGYAFNKKHAVSYSDHTFEDDRASDYERSSLTYVYNLTPSFQLYAQATTEERGGSDDDAIAVGAGIFF